MRAAGLPRSYRAYAAVVVVAFQAAFWVPALRRTGGRVPVPLDDVFIHFGFARSLALGHPFEWIPGNGYSSGATSLTYPFVLAPGVLLGFRGERLALFAALVASALLVDLAFSLAKLLERPPRWVLALAPLFVFAVPFVDWSFFSGMEVALLGALTGRSLVALRRAERASPVDRPSAQRAVGVWLAILALTRPEAALLALALGIATAHAAGTVAAVASLVRALGPTAFALGAQTLANRAFTGESAPAGAVRKAIWTDPYAPRLELVLEAVRNFVALREQAFDTALGGGAIAFALPTLALTAILAKRTRRLGLALAVSSVASLALVSFNATARFQNLRYAVPSVLWLLLGGALGVRALAGSRLGAVVGAALAALALAGPMKFFPRQIEHFAAASKNIADQQVEVARRLAARVPRTRRVFVGDAGAIPYLSGLPAIDGLGLGGFRGLPFARASVHGIPAVVELIERLPPEDRPDVFALYPSWWRGLADVFGTPVDSVKIEGNVICGADEKVLYAADWSALAPFGEPRGGDVVDSLDVADLVDERAHAFSFHEPQAGYVVGRILGDASGRPRFDAGRVLPAGTHEAFTVAADVPLGPATLELRTDPGAPFRVAIEFARGAPVVIASSSGEGTRWVSLCAEVSALGGGDVVTLRVLEGSFRSYHLFVRRPTGSARIPPGCSND